MRDDFGYFTVCNHSPGAYLYKLDGQTLFTEAARLVPGMNIGELASAGSQLLYAGSTGETCRVTVESAAFGLRSADVVFLHGHRVGRAVGKDAIERFMREARSVARLKSEHVARVFDVGRDENDNPYMVLELLEGLDLAKLN